MKIGDRVINTKATAGIPEGMTGTVAEDSDCPWVKWDNGETWCRNDDYLELVEDDHVG
jgi:hypothetical protein